jgi:hypothetical protein
MRHPGANPAARSHDEVSFLSFPFVLTSDIPRNPHECPAELMDCLGRHNDASRVVVLAKVHEKRTYSPEFQQTPRSRTSIANAEQVPHLVLQDVMGRTERARQRGVEVRAVRVCAREVVRMVSATVPIEAAPVRSPEHHDRPGS